MLHALKSLVRGTPLETPARRVYAALTGRAMTDTAVADSHAPYSDGNAETPQPASAPGPDANATYDAQTAAVMARVLEPTSVCVDVGCHAGEILDEMRRLAPHGHHYGFEPLPDLFAALRARYADAREVTLHNCALSDTAGTFQFQHVVSNPGYSGFRKRRYDRPSEEVVATEVTAARLDEMLPADIDVALIKIDVEGAELQVLKGAEATLRRCRPVVIFEHGLGAADVYGTRPEHIHELLAQAGLRIFLMSEWLNSRPPLDLDAFTDEFDSGRNYYFMAAP